MNRRSRIALAPLIFIALELALIGFVDRPLSEYLRTVDAGHPVLINIFRAYTDLGKSVWYLWPSGLSIILCVLVLRLKITSGLREKLARLGNMLLFLFVSVAVSGIVTDIIKPIVGRARPVELEREGLYGFHPFSFTAVWNSMPSGHATTAFALASVFSILLPRGRIAFFALGVALAVSRIMVNAHYLSDVIAGCAVGCLTSYAVWALINHNGINHCRQCIFPIDNKNLKS